MPSFIEARNACCTSVSLYPCPYCQTTRSPHCHAPNPISIACKNLVSLLISAIGCLRKEFLIVPRTLHKVKEKKHTGLYPARHLKRKRKSHVDGATRQGRACILKNQCMGASAPSRSAGLIVKFSPLDTP